jgi:uncharacterized protein YcbX
VAEVTALGLVPVKGMRLVEPDRLELTERGPRGDRDLFVVDARTGRLLRTSRNPKLMAIVPSWDPATETLGLTFPDEEVRGVVEPGEPHTIENYAGRPIRGRLVDGPPAEALSAHLGRPVRLLRRDPDELGADDAPVTLMSTASLDALGTALEDGAPDPRRFRMSITADGLEPWEEHGWGGREIAVGDAVLRGVDPVVRCVITMRDPDTGRGDVPVLTALAELRGKRDVTFGLLCDVVRPGVVRLGDSVRVQG